ncbi:hypothetical protein CBL_11056 [Carabus blaptoides fortunei]
MGTGRMVTRTALPQAQNVRGDTSEYWYMKELAGNMEAGVCLYRVCGHGDDIRRGELFPTVFRGRVYDSAVVVITICVTPRVIAIQIVICCARPAGSIMADLDETLRTNQLDDDSYQYYPTLPSTCNSPSLS